MWELKKFKHIILNSDSLYWFYIKKLHAYNLIFKIFQFQVKSEFLY